jgi:glutamine synthetase
VYSTLGAEQEFFLIDRGFYLLRPDLIATGRTLIGSKPPKGQELEEHYFGKMPRRVQACLEEVDHELWELGVPSMTRHNEVGPSQYEMAPIFEKSTLACDHNMLTMVRPLSLVMRSRSLCQIANRLWWLHALHR